MKCEACGCENRWCDGVPTDNNFMVCECGHEQEIFE